MDALAATRKQDDKSVGKNVAYNVLYIMAKVKHSSFPSSSDKARNGPCLFLEEAHPLAKKQYDYRFQTPWLRE